MSSLHPGSPWILAQPTAWLATALLCLSCSTAGTPARFQPQPTWSGPLTGGRSQFNQSCGAACATPVSASTGEFLAPAAARLSPVTKKVVLAVEAAQGLLTLERALTGAELDRLEGFLKECVAQAHADVNESYQKQDGGFRFKNGKFPNDAECDRAVRFDEQGEKVSLAQELGMLKHAAAFACIEARLSKEFGDNFSVEPRYKGNPDAHGAVLTKEGPESLVPDLVVHATRNATNIQCVYELKFPCLEKHRLNPMDSFGVREQLTGYQKLSNRCPVALVTPSGLKQLGVD